jgi:poly(3-hydroxyalkanoate) synthetase
VLNSTNEEPKLVREVVDSTEGRLWKDAMVKEMESSHKNETWDVVKLPSGRNLVGSKWVFTKKMNVASQVKKFKARLVAKGHSQVERVDFGEIFSPYCKINFH